MLFNKESYYREVMSYVFEWLSENIDGSLEDDDNADRYWHMLGAIVEKGPYWNKHQHRDAFNNSYNESGIYDQLFDAFDQIDVPVLKQGDLIEVDKKVYIIESNHNGKYILQDIDEPEEIDEQKEVSRLGIPTQQEVDKYLDSCGISPREAFTDTFGRMVKANFQTCSDWEAWHFAWVWRWYSLDKEI